MNKAKIIMREDGSCWSCQAVKANTWLESGVAKNLYGMCTHCASYFPLFWKKTPMVMVPDTEAEAWDD